MSPDGARIGKGEGYSEIEYGILRELGLVGENVTILTTVHPVQIVTNLPQDPYDVSIDYIITPEETIRTHRNGPSPKGIIWDLVNPGMLSNMPVLKQLKEKKLS